MKLKLELTNLFWWFWSITLAFIIAAIAGWSIAYLIVILISSVQVVVFLIREKSILAFPVQIRIVYLAWTLTGFWVGGRLIFYCLLLLGTVMVVFFGRCSISLMLKYMPWNKSRVARLV